MKNLFLVLASLFSASSFAQSSPTFAQFKFSPILARTAFQACVPSRIGEVRAGSTVSPTESAVVYICDGTNWRVLGPGIAIGDPVYGGTPNSILFVDANGDLGDDANFVFNEVLGKMGLGLASASVTSNSAKLQVSNSLSNPASSVDPSSVSSSSFLFVTSAGTYSSGSALKGLGSVSVGAALSTSASITGLSAQAEKAGAGTTSGILAAGDFQSTNTAGTAQFQDGITVASQVSSGATTTEKTQVRLIGNTFASSGTITNNWGILQQPDVGVGPVRKNHFTGQSIFNTATSTIASPAMGVDIVGDFGARFTDVATAGAINNLSSSDTSSIRLTAATSLSGVANGANGKRLVLANATGGTITITNEDAASLAANRIITGTGASLSLLTGSAQEFVYDATAQRWRAIGAVAGSGGGGGGAADGLELGIATQVGAVSYNVLSGPERYLRCDSTAGDVDYVLPNIANAGTVVWFKRISAGANNCTIDVSTNGTTLDGSGVDNPFLLSSQWNAVAIIYTGGAWEIMP